MKNAIATLLHSRKTYVALATAMIWLVATFGLKLPITEVQAVLTTMGALFLGYVLEDFSKGDVKPRSMMQVLNQLITSKKALATMASIVLFFAAKLGLPLSAAILDPILNGIAAIVLAIGVQDFGKSSQSVRKRK